MNLVPSLRPIRPRATHTTGTTVAPAQAMETDDEHPCGDSVVRSRGQGGDIDAALLAMAEHIQEAHTGITAGRVFRQFAGGEAHRAYWWLEEYDSFTALESESITEDCDRVWQPIRDIEIPGTHKQMVWTDVAKAAWFAR